MPAETHLLRGLLHGVAATVFLAAVAHADEGFWPYSALPTTLQPQWTDNLLKASARLEIGGSGAFVSRQGLFLTAQHIAESAVASLNTASRNITRDGFLARSLQEELRTNARIEALDSIEDVTARIEAVAVAATSPAEQATARSKAIAETEKRCATAPELRCRVASLAAGARYELHRYRIFSDVRLVFCPADSVASLRRPAKEETRPILDAFALDFCLLRVYENGEPAAVEHFLKWSRRPVRAGEPVFASGYPFSSTRWQPVARLQFLRDVKLPQDIATQRALIAAFEDLDDDSAAARAISGARATLENALSQAAVLQNPKWMEAKRREEEHFKRQLALPRRSDALTAFEELQSILQAEAATEACSTLINYDSPGSPLFGTVSLGFYVESFLSAAAELSKPPEGRNARYRRPTWAEEAAWYWSQDIDRVNKPVEQAALSAWLDLVDKAHCANGTLARDLLAGRSPQRAAAEIMKATRVGEPAFHKSLMDADDDATVKAIRQSSDPLIAFARRLHAEMKDAAPMRAARQRADTTEDQIVRSQYQMFPDDVYPDASRTLRLSYGSVRGYEWKGRRIPAVASVSTFNLWMDEQSQQARDGLPENWRARRKELKRSDFSFASTLDLASGSSGSPVVNRRGELVGLVASFAPTGIPKFTYDADLSRTISLSSSVMVEALRKIYGANELVRELMQGETMLPRTKTHAPRATVSPVCKNSCRTESDLSDPVPARHSDHAVRM